MVAHPVEYIREGIERVCEAVPLYKSFKEDVLNAKELRVKAYSTYSGT